MAPPKVWLSIRRHDLEQPTGKWDIWRCFPQGLLEAAGYDVVDTAPTADS
jgi:hypothetical protein